MRKSTQIGVVVAVPLVAVPTLYFMLKTDNGSQHDYCNETRVPTPNAIHTIIQTP
jgi:hypothetical protein